MWRCTACAFQAPGRSGYVDLLGGPTDETADHYSLQWGAEFGFLDFVRANRAAKAVMPAGQLGWDELIEEIRRAATERVVHVYDAGCGFGGITSDLLDDGGAPGLVYLGSDIHDALPLIAERIPGVREQGLLVRWDIGNPPPVREAFDYVVCRASLHHTPDPPKTFTALARALKPGGTIAISVYRKKGVCREALDDALRGIISRLPRQQAFELSRQFTVIGKALQEVATPLDIPEDLPLLGIPRGRTSVHSLVYYHLLKCFYNPTFGDRYSTLVNYDWYHPPYAYRYDLDEVRSWFAATGIDVIDVRSIEAQHYVAGRKPMEAATHR
jgi:SAM-dependent methyltransferase